MQKKFSKDGLVVLSLNIDDEKDQRDGAIQFLQKSQVPFTNFILAPGENKDAWDAELKFGGFPLQFIYGRDGKKLHMLEGAEPQEVEQKVEAALKKQ
jgi:hypothetical protein